MKRTARISRKARQERGAATIEMAMVFTLFFGIMWATVSYTLPFFVYQVMNHAASEAARAAVRADPELGDSAYTAKLETLAAARLASEYNWMPAKFQQALTTTVNVIAMPGNPSARMLVVRLTYPNYNSNPIVPALTLPVLGTIPNIPGNLTAESHYRL